MGLKCDSMELQVGNYWGYAFTVVGMVEMVEMVKMVKMVEMVETFELIPHVASNEAPWELN